MMDYMGFCVYRRCNFLFSGGMMVYVDYEDEDFCY